MVVVNCLCGERIDAPDITRVVAELRAHAQSAHPQWPLTDEKARSFLASRDVTGGWSGERTDEADVEIRSLTPDSAPDFLRFFDGDAFVDNPAWSSCYCYAHKFTGTQDEWDARGAAENRADQEACIRAGTTRGLLAYADGRPMAWCHAAPRNLLPGFDAGDETNSGDLARTGAIVCFVVSPAYRGQGVASRLLGAACAMLREQGCDTVQAFPVREGVPTTNARAYHGPLSMYLNAGFAILGERENFAQVEKTLG